MASSMMVMIIGKTSKPNALLSVGQISAPVCGAPANLHGLSEQHEFRQDQGLDDGDAPGGEFDALGVQHRGLHQNHRSEGDVEIKRNEYELLELVHGALA